MRKWLFVAILCVLCSFAYGATYNETVLWANEFVESGSPNTGNDVTDLLDGTGEMGAASCDISTIVAAAAGNPVTVTSAGFGFYTSTGSGSPIQYWELNNVINGSELDGVCAGVFCDALKSNMTSLIGVHTGLDAAGVWEWYGVNESAMATLFQTYINAGEMNVSIIKNNTDPTGADFENVRGLDYSTASQRPRCFIEYSIATTPKTLYVDPESVGGACSDVITRAANNITNPFCSMQTALNLMSDGDAIDLRDGNHSQTRNLAGTSQVGGFEYTSPTTWTNSLKIYGHPGETAILTSQIDGSTAGTWVLSGGIWRLPYGGYNEYLRYYIRNITTGKKWELLAYDDDVGDMDSYADMADSTNPYGCYADETTDDYIECRLPSWVNPNTPGTFYFTNTTTTLFLDNQQGAPTIIANLTVEPASRAGIYITDGANAIIEHNEFYGGLWAIRYARFENMTIRHNYALQDYYQDEIMAWNEHRKGETAETDFVHCDDDPTYTNISFNYIEGWFNGLLLYNQDADNGVNGLYIGYNNFSRIYDDSIEVEDAGYTSHHTHNRFNNTFIAFSFHPYDDPTHSTLVDYNYYYNPMYNYFYKGGSSYYGEAVKTKSGDGSYTEGVNFNHNTFLGNGIAANAGQTNTQFYNNWTNNIYQTTASNQYLISTTGEEADHVFYDYNIYDSSNYYMRYYGSDSISTIYYSLASAIATGRLASSNTNSIDADPLLDADGVPYPNSPACGAASDGTDIGAFACAVSTSNVTVTIISPANNSVTGEQYPTISYNTTRLSDCNIRTVYMDIGGSSSITDYFYNVPANTTRTYIEDVPSMQAVRPGMTYFKVRVSCIYLYSTDTTDYITVYIDTDTPIPVLTYPTSATNIRNTASEQWINLNGSCYDQTLDDAQIYIINSTGGWYYSDNQTGLDALNITTYTWNTNVSMVGWPSDEYTVIVNCSDVPNGNDFTQTTFDFQTNVTVVAYNPVYRHIEDWNLTIGSNWYNVNGTNGTIWVDTNTEYTFNGTDDLYTIVGKTVLINQTSAIINLTATLKNPTVDQCSGYYTYPVLNISYFSEQTGASINVTSAYSVYFYDGNATPSVQYLSYSNSAYTTFCTDVNPSFTTATLLFYGQAILSKTNYDTRIYNIPYVEGITVSNNPVKQYSMYLLPTANSTTVTYNWYTTSFVPINGNMLIYRCEADGTKTLVDAPLITDGVATANIQAYYTVYSYAVVIDGTTYLDDSYTACHTESLTERTYYVDILESPILPLADLYGASCRLQKTGANEVKLTWSADESVEACIVAERQTVAGSFQIYENCTTSQSGSMTRTIANNSNTYYVKGTLSDGTYTAYCVDMVTITVKSDAQTTFGIFGAFATGLFILAIALLFLPDLQLSIVGSIIALIAAFLLGFIAFGWGAVFMLIVFLIAVMWIGRYNRKQ